MTKTELETKHLADLHSLAADAGVPRYRMLRREELIEKLSDGKPAQGEREPRGEGRPKRDRPPRRRERPAGERPSRERSARDSASTPASSEPVADESTPSPAEPEPAAAAAAAPAAEPSRPRRRRRRFGRKSKGLRVHDLLMPPPGRQALVYGESRATCTALLREVAGELAGADSPDPIALLIDPSPEELADWKREAPRAEIVAAGQARHATDALEQASRRAEGGEHVILLVDSLSRLEESFGDADSAKKLFDAGLTQANGSLTVVAALEHQS